MRKQLLYGGKSTRLGREKTRSSGKDGDGIGRALFVHLDRLITLSSCPSNSCRVYFPARFYTSRKSAFYRGQFFARLDFFSPNNFSQATNSRSSRSPARNRAINHLRFPDRKFRRENPSSAAKEPPPLTTTGHQDHS